MPKPQKSKKMKPVIGWAVIDEETNEIERFGWEYEICIKRKDAKYNLSASKSKYGRIAKLKITEL